MERISSGYPSHNFSVYSQKHDIELIEVVKPDFVFFLGWSWLVPKKITDNFTCICIHPSNLISYRGGSPLQNQIADGIHHSMITMFKMTEEMDWGPVYAQRQLDLSGDINEIFVRIEDKSVDMLVSFFSGGYKHAPVYFDVSQLQPPLKRRKPEESEITQEELKTKTAEQLYDKIRMLTGPYPHAFIVCADGQKLYLTGASL
jgi:methionyl-tRNA formyltransferase